ncbi:hypothetical protein D3C75_1113810 [compost metagenome]
MPAAPAAENTDSRSFSRTPSGIPPKRQGPQTAEVPPLGSLAHQKPHKARTSPPLPGKDIHADPPNPPAGSLLLLTAVFPELS